MCAYTSIRDVLDPLDESLVKQLYSEEKEQRATWLVDCIGWLFDKGYSRQSYLYPGAEHLLVYI